MEKMIEIELKMILNVRPKYKVDWMELFVFRASIVYFHRYKDKIPSLPSYVNFFRLEK